ncbi:hypothetical protein JCM10213_001382 [Rhodosporidiobolus nylandii]
MADQPASAPQANRPTKTQQVHLPPFDSAASIVASLQTRDPPTLIAALTQLDKRAQALNAKPAPRGSPDLLLDYLKHYPGAEGVFQAWDTANKTNSSPLSTAVLSCLTSLLRLLSTDPFTPSPELIKILLSAKYAPYLERALNPGRNDVTTAALKMANVLVGFAGGRFARRTFGCFGWSPKITTRLYKTRLRSLTSTNALTKPDIRTLLVLLVLGFLSAGDVRLKQQVLETKGLLGGVFKGLNEDPESVVGLVLEVVGREIVLERRVGLEARRNVFDEGTVNELIKLYSVPLPALSSDEDEVLSASHPSLSVHRFLRLLTAWLAEQIATSPVGRSGGPQKVLGLVLRGLKVTEEREQRELGLEVLREAPVLAGAFWAKFPSSLDPRLSSRWISAITFATQVVSLPVPLTLSPSLSTSTTPAPPSLTSILDTILPPSTPSTLNRAWYTRALSHETPLVSFLSSLFLLAILQKAAASLECLAATSARLEEGPEGRWATAARRVREELKGRLPDPGIVVALMSKAGGAVGGEGKKEKEKGKKGAEKATNAEDTSMQTEQSEEKKHKEKEKAKDDPEGALLRTNIALRLLFLYHRVAPSLISTLKFDFARLPQTFAARAALPSSSDDSEEPQGEEEEKALRPEGLQALTSAYALRLAAAHAAPSGASTAAWSRPADHYKQVLVPLFELYRVPATASNRSLLRSILARQLATPVLFGQSEGEVEVWLRALPVPRPGNGKEGDEKDALDFVQEQVRKTLTTPLKAADLAAAAAAASDVEGVAFSPLLKTLLAALPSLPSPPSPALLAFLKNLFLSFLSSSTSLALPRKLLTELKDALTVKGDAGRAAVKAMKEALAVVEGKEGDVELATGLEGVKDEEDEEEVRKLVEGAAPKSANVCKALEADEEGLKRALAALPLPLALLHYLSHPVPSALPALLTLISASSSHLPAVQLLLHRFVHAPSPSVGSLISQVYASCTDAAVKVEIKLRLAGKDGVRKVWEKDGESQEAYGEVVQLLASVFDEKSEEDREMVKGFTEVVLRDLEGEAVSPRKKGKKAASSTLSVRVLSTAPLLPFFSTTSSLPLLSALLSSSTVPDTLLNRAFALILALPPSSALTAFWTAHFSRLNALTAAGSVEAGELLRKGAAALLPFSFSVVGVAAKKDDSWRAHATQWAEELLSARELAPAQGTALAALVYRSAAARARFATYLASAPESSLVALAEPLKALLEVGGAKGVAAVLPEGLPASFASALLAVPGAASDSALAVLRLLAASSPAAAAAVKQALDAHVSALGMNDITAQVVEVVAAFAEIDKESGKAALEECVNTSAEGLVRKFAGQESDEDEVKELVAELATVVEKTQGLALKGHLLSPLITAIATRRLDQPYAVELATALSKAHRFKDVEVTRHLNEIFASDPFLAFSSAPREASPALAPALSLILALSSTSASAAASSRAAERLIPFYRATLSAQDRALLSLFQRIELASGQSVSPVLRGWNPSTDASTLLDGSRVGALGAAQRAYTRRSWARAFASSRTSFTPEEDAKTYDPRFLIAFVAALVEEDELKPQDWTTVLESGALGTVVASLASSEASMRLMARATLAGLAKKIPPLSFREKDELQLVLTQCRLAVYSPAGEALPSSIALFLAHCTSLIGQPDSPLYPAFERFLLQRSTIDLRDVPMFYSMVYSSNADEYAAEPKEERKWMVRFLSEGLVRVQDWKIYRRRQVFELLASLFQASRADPSLRKLILQFLLRATTLPTAARELLTRNGLLGWLTAAASTALDVGERRLLLGIIANVVEVLSFEESKLAGVADAVEAVEAAVGSEVAVMDASKLLDLLRLIVSNLPAPSASSSSSLFPLILSRISSLLFALSSSLDLVSAPKDTLQRFYLATMALSFVRFEAGLKEEKRDVEVWQKAVQAGMAAGVDELRKEVLRGVCE